VRATDLPDGDVTKPERIRSVLGSWQADWIVNLAARTAVDDCEADPEGTFAVNAIGAENAARLAAGAGARLLQMSTDYVFDGRKGSPYSEEDGRNPLSAYGRSKAEGEDRVRAVLPPDRLLLVRAQSLYGRGPKSFPDTIRTLAKTRPEIAVVTDQVVQPTWARELADWLARLVGLGGGGASGDFHVAASGSCSWNELARAVLQEWAIAGVRITDTTAAALGRPAARPACSVFDTRKFEERTGVRPKDWRAQLGEYRRSQEAAA
jgi:dTDP-4-dehydrorhamnose reductase